MVDEKLYFSVELINKDNIISLFEDKSKIKINQIQLKMKDVEKVIKRKLRRNKKDEAPDIVVWAMGEARNREFIDGRSFRGMSRRYYNFA